MGTISMSLCMFSSAQQPTWGTRRHFPFLTGVFRCATVRRFHAFCHPTRLDLSSFDVLCSSTMVDWQDPQTVTQDWLSVAKVIHFASGLYIWEWLTNLPFDWHFICNLHEHRAPAVIYILCRFVTLGAVITELINADVSGEINCMAEWRGVMCLGYISIALSSSLIVIRAIAVWNHNKFIMVFVIAVYLTNVGFMIHDVVVSAQAVWSPVINNCILTDEVRNKPLDISCVVTDGILLIVVLVGIVRFKGSGSLWTLMYHQGIIWFAAAIVVYIPPTILVSLNLNDPLNSILQPLTYVIMAICASRMHRNLYKFAHPAVIGSSIATPNFKPFSRTERSTLPSTAVPLEDTSRKDSRLDSRDNALSEEGVAAKNDSSVFGAHIV